MAARPSSYALFSQLAESSRFWLPPLLCDLARSVATMLRADGCSIFLLFDGPKDREKRLHLAGTTRAERLTHLCDPAHSYAVDPGQLRVAAKRFEQTGRITDGDVGLTAWVVAFKRSLLVKDLHNGRELDRLADSRRRIPRPLWSSKNRSFLDNDAATPRPFLCSPIRSGKTVLGAIRAATSRLHPQEFTRADLKRIEGFADDLGDFLSQTRVLARPGLAEIFRIWSAEDMEVLAERITRTVPALFGVDSCSLFLRDADRRYVLRNSACVNTGNRTFQAFVQQNKGNLYYRIDDRSKTGTALALQRPMIVASQNGDYKVEVGPTTGSSLPSQSGGQYLRGPRPEVTCEFPHETPKSIVLVPVDDQMSISSPAGLLRIVSKGRLKSPDSVLTELLQFSYELSGVVAKRASEDLQQRARAELVSALAGNETTRSQKLARSASIVCEAIQASAVTIFVHHSGRLVTQRDFAHLAAKYLERPDLEEYAAIAEHHEVFRNNLPMVAVGEGRTGSVALTREVLNLRNLNDEEELRRKGISHIHDNHCELKNAGPFLAAPIVTGPEDRKIIGVIRALRRAKTTHGAFTSAHEDILSSCAMMLAALLKREQWRAAVAYKQGMAGDERRTLLEVVSGWIESLGGEALVLEDRAASEDPSERFAEMLDRADVAVVIATRDHRRSNKRYSPSQYVVEECAQALSHPRTRERRLVLMMEDVVFPNEGVLAGSRVLRFGKRPGDIRTVYEEFRAAIAEWFEGRVT